MKATLIGTTGFIGVPLCQELKRAGLDITVLARDPASAKKALGTGCNVLPWKLPQDIPDEALRDADVIINLAGESIGTKRWSEARKKDILNSRVLTTRAIVDSLHRFEGKQRTLISGSAVGYYGPRGNEGLCEDSRPGDDFLASVCRKWEAEAFKALELGVRVIAVRTGFVLGKGGALDRMVIPFKFFAGGPVGSGNQWLPWIHLDDLIGIIKFSIENGGVDGPINATAPNPLTMRQFSKALGRAIGRPSWLPVPGFILKLALGEMSDLLLNGQRALPCKALKLGYRFKYRHAEEALRAILG